jgi:hypothetical protein
MICDNSTVFNCFHLLPSDERTSAQNILIKHLTDEQIEFEIGVPSTSSVSEIVSKFNQLTYNRRIECCERFLSYLNLRDMMFEIRIV